MKDDLFNAAAAAIKERCPEITDELARELAQLAIDAAAREVAKRWDLI